MRNIKTADHFAAKIIASKASKHFELPVRQFCHTIKKAETKEG